LRPKLRPAVTLFLVLWITCLAGQTQETVRETSNSATNVEFLFSVTAKKAGPLPQITAAELGVFEDGDNQNLTGLRLAEELPLAVGILLDSSLRNRAFGRVVPMAEEEKVVTEFLKASIRTQDKSVWIKFAQSSPNLAGIIDLSDRAGMQQAVDLGRSPQAGTELLQAVDAYRGELAGAQAGRRAVIIIANGGTFLGLDVYKRIVEIALRDKIIVYVVDACPRPGAYGPRGPNEAMLPRTSSPQQVVALVGSIKQSLGSLATETGGVYLEAFSKSEMTRALSRLHDQLNSQYIVTYSPSGLHRLGQFHKVQIRAVDGSVAIQAPKGYYVPSH
jgi:VWFA-related protein